MENVVDTVIELFRLAGRDAYFGEPVSQEELQRAVDRQTQLRQEEADRIAANLPNEAELATEFAAIDPKIPALKKEDIYRSILLDVGVDGSPSAPPRRAGRALTLRSSTERLAEFLNDLARGGAESAIVHLAMTRG